MCKQDISIALASMLLVLMLVTGCRHCDRNTEEQQVSPVRTSQLKYLVVKESRAYWRDC
ncbi:hypothetical protein ACFL54_05885 [Planctomycetota bacterium]